MGHDDGAPLVATYKQPRPPWIGLWSTREYKGRPDWWREAGVRDDVARKQKYRAVHHRYKEEDPEFYDPKVPDGTSISGPIGLDSLRHPNITIKGDQPGKLEDFQDMIWKSSHQYKNIAEKFDISKEHPGFDVNPCLVRLDKHALNEAAHEKKGLAAAKYTAMLMLPYTMCEIRSTSSVAAADFTPRNFLKRYFQLAPTPTILAFAWGFSLSAAATFRNKDDVKNHFIASAALGATLATMKDNIPLGISVGVTALVLGTFWQYNRVSEEGTHGLVGNPGSAGIWGGPLMWKAFQWGDAKVPDTRY
ncbi:hypothetical protein COOONC_05252 [Cooperia oncophora]